MAARDSIYLAGRSGQFRHQPQRNRQLVQLEVRPQERDGAIARPACRELPATSIVASRKRLLRLDVGRCRVVRRDVVRDPLVQQALALRARHEAADLVAHHGLQVVREARDGQDVGQLRREPRIGVGRVGVVQLGLLRGLHAEERRVIGALAVHQRNEAEVRQFLLAAVGDRRLRWGTSWRRRLRRCRSCGPAGLPPGRRLPRRGWRRTSRTARTHCVMRAPSA